MSGYLEVKYPFKSNLGLNPFKSWKRQWCILRPSPTFSGGILAVYCSEAGATAGTVELPWGFVVRRAKSRTRPHAFAVFPVDEPRKPRVLLAASSLHEAQVWMDKIKSLINGNQIETEGSLKDSFSVTVTATELARKCGLNGADSTVTVTSGGVLVSHLQKAGVFVPWKHINDVSLSTDITERNGICIITVDSGFIHGSGFLHFTSPLAGALARAVKAARASAAVTAAPAALAPRALSKSDGELNKDYNKSTDVDIGEVRRSSWYSGPSEVSLDDLDLVMAKVGPTLSRCRGAGDLPVTLTPAVRHVAVIDSMSDRRSVASGIYEEIPDLPEHEDGVYCKMSRHMPLPAHQLLAVAATPVEPTYESVAECVYTLPRARPPPLPPRAVHSGSRSSEWCNVTRHGSLGSLPPAAARAPAVDRTARTLPRWDRSRHAFTAFRKRLKSDSRVASVISPKSETPKDKDVETKKKKFDFAPTRDIFKSFKVSRKMKNLKIATGTLTKGETKSCEFLDDTELVKTSRCSKSVEWKGDDDFLEDFGADLSQELDEHIASLSLPREIFDLILKGQEKLNQICSKEEENHYLPMSPIGPPIEHHYIVMSPKTNTA